MTANAVSSAESPAFQRRIRGFDGLRAVAILLVILWHTRLLFDSLGWLEPIVSVGWAGVDLFFGLSGFLITSLLLDEERENEREHGRRRFSMRDFYARRLLRIFPPYYTVLLLTALVLSRFASFPTATWPWDGQTPPLYVASFLFLFSNYVDLGTSIGFAYIVNWSLCVEEHFYLLWPATLRLVRSFPARITLGVAVCVLIPFLRLHALAAGFHPLRIHSISHLRIDSILWGAVAALLFHWLQRHPLLRRSILAISVAGALWFVSTGRLAFSPLPTLSGEVAGLTTLAIAVAAFVTEIASTPQSGIVRVLELAPFRAVGRVSYGMYLLHFQSIDLVRMAAPQALRNAPPAVAFLIFTATVSLVTFALAALMYRVVERPALRLKRHFPGAARH